MVVEVVNNVTGALQSASAVPILLRGQITYAAGTTGAVGATTLFTVTGDVSLSLIAAKCTTDLTSAGAPTWTLGVTGQADITGVAGIHPDVTGWDAGEWADLNGPAYLAGGGSNANIIGNNLKPVMVSANIIQTISTATITGGVVVWYLQYVPLSANGKVELHSNLVAV